MELRNNGKETAELAWGRFSYSIDPGETKNFPEDLAEGFLLRFSDLSPVKQETKTDEGAKETLFHAEETGDAATRKRSRKPS